MHALVTDLRYALRVLRRRPWVTTVVLLTLAIGIGANTAIFSFIDAILLRPLPYKDVDRIVGIWERRPSGQRNSMSTLNYLDYAAQSSVFEHIAATTNCCSATILGGATPTPLAGMKVSASYFDVFGAKAALGRTFDAGEDQPGRNHVVVLSHRVWASRFGSDAALIGRTIRLDDEPYTVIGVMPENSPFDRSFIEIWLPISFEGERMNRSSHRLLSLTGAAIGLLRPGVSIERARAEMDAVAARLSTEYPASNQGWGIELEPYGSVIVSPELRRSLYLLVAAVGMVLIIACVNVANMMLAWALARDREVAVRLALGAPRSRLIRQFLTESLLISCAGGALGIAAGYGTLSLLRTTLAALPVTIGTLPILIPADASVQLNWRVLLFALIVSVACGVIFGVAPAITTIRGSRATTMSGHRASATVTQRRLRSALIVAQVALAFVLLTNAGLLIRSFLKMREADTGFDAANVLTVQLSRSERHFANAAQLHTFMREVMAGVRAIPGVSDAAFVDSMPMNGAPRGTFVQIASRPIIERAQRPVADFKLVGPGYFHVLGLRLHRGRVLSELDRDTTPLVAVINETTARTFFPDSDPIGQRLLMDAPGFGTMYTGEAVPYEIVGVIADERLTPFDDRGEHSVIYASTEQDGRGFGGIIIRTALDTAHIESSIRAKVAAVDKGVAITHMKTVDALKAESMIPDRFRSAVLGVFAALALVLSAIGIYGVIAYSVAQRTLEIGIRSALGATPANLMEWVVGDGLALIAVGLAFGGAGAVGVARLLTSFLYGVGTADPMTWTTATIILVSVAALACYIPARYAARVDPLEALRAD